LFLTSAKETSGDCSLQANHLAELLKKALEALMARSGATPGDKTVLDLY